MRVVSTLCSRKGRSRPLAACLFLLVLTLPDALPSAAGPLRERLDSILQGAKSGIVRVDVRRPWIPESASPHAASERALAVRRIRGNGLLWDQAGHVITVADLAQPGDTIRIFGPDGQPHPARFIGQDPVSGLSLVQIAQGLPARPAERGDSRSLLEQNWVMTLGFLPEEGEEHLTVTKVSGGTHEGDIWKARLEVAGDPALAGGGVLDEEGRLIGMLLGQGRETILLHSKDRTRSIEYPLECTGPTEAGWILPVDLIESVADGLIDAGDEGQGFLGVSVEIPRQEAAASRSASSSSGLLVSRVLAGSPAQRCGILPGDRITGLNGQPVTDWNALTQAVAARGPGETIEIDLQRNGKRISMPVRLEDRAHVIWRERQRMLAGGREKRLRGQIEQLTHQLELLRHQLQGQ